MNATEANESAAILQTALEALKREDRSAKLRLALCVAIWALALLLVVLGVGWLTEGHTYGMFPLTFALLCILISTLTAPRRHSQALDTLHAIADVQAIGPLLDLLPGAFASRRQSMLSLLTLLLPQLQTVDAGLLRPTHRNQLRDALVLGDFGREREYQVAILKAMEQIGNREDLVVVERLAEGESDTWQERQVRDAAQACLPRLREQVEQQKHRDNLLRPASAVRQEELLHPVFEAGDPAPTQLLRPDQSTPKEKRS